MSLGFPPGEVAHIRAQTRLEVAHRQSPRLLMWMTAVVLVLTGLIWWEEPEAPSDRIALNLIASACLAIGALIGRQPHLPLWTIPWITSAALTVLGITTIAHLALASKPIDFAYLAIVLTAMGPIVLGWRPFIAGAALLLVILIPVVATWPLQHGSEWLLAAVTATGVGSALLAFRMNAIEGHVASQLLIEELATTDRLTGVLNRHGFDTQSTRLPALASRLDTGMFAVFIDIDGLKAANDAYGHPFGDEVIRTSAAAVVANTRADDLVVRWGGDELVVVGLGECPQPDTLTERLLETVELSGIDRSKWPGCLSVGTAQSAPGATSLATLIGQADADMYKRRQERTS